MSDESREVCVCFHVPLGKLLKFYRLRRPKVASEFSKCHGAGTGCGWCVPHLDRLFEQLDHGQAPILEMSAEEYQRRRLEYHRTKKPDLAPGASSKTGELDFDLDAIIEQIPDDLKLD